MPEDISMRAAFGLAALIGVAGCETAETGRPSSGDAARAAERDIARAGRPRRLSPAPRPPVRGRRPSPYRRRAAQRHGDTPGGARRPSASRAAISATVASTVIVAMAAARLLEPPSS